MRTVHKDFRHACTARILALFALVLLTGCAGQRTTPAPVAEIHVRTAAHKTVREPRPTEQRTGLAAEEVGYYLDALQGRLLQKASAGIDVARHGDGIAVGIPIAKDPAQLRETLRSIAKILIEYRFVRVSVASAPTAGEDASVAQNRALDASRALNRGGVAASRIGVAGNPTSGTPAYIQLLLEPIVQSGDPPAEHRRER